jgi:hypothetical protein
MEVNNMAKLKEQYVSVRLEAVLELQKEIQRLRQYDGALLPGTNRFADGLKHASTILDLPLRFVEKRRNVTANES